MRGIDMKSIHVFALALPCLANIEYLLGIHIAAHMALTVIVISVVYPCFKVYN